MITISIIQYTKPKILSLNKLNFTYKISIITNDTTYKIQAIIIIYFIFNQFIIINLFIFDNKQALIKSYSIGFSGITTSPFCPRWRKKWSSNTIANIASAIGTARTPTHGS